MASPICIELGRVTAFYAPTIALLKGGFLEAEGLEAVASVAKAGRSSLDALSDGSVHVAQSAPSRSFSAASRQARPSHAHFALVNARDGFFLVGREHEPSFDWNKLQASSVVADQSPQPMASLRFAARKMGLNVAAINLLNVGANRSVSAFVEGIGDYVQVQGDDAYQLEATGAGHIVAAIGDVVGPLAFTSLAATREWLQTDDAIRFVRAYEAALQWVSTADPSEVSAMAAPLLPSAHRDTLTQAVGAYQACGTWSTKTQITRPLFDAAVDLFYEANTETRPAFENFVSRPSSERSSCSL